VQYALRLSALGMSSAIALHCERSVAQLNLTPDTAPDRNLGTNVVPLTPEIDLITGGTQPQAGSNLFHSFSEFNVAPGRGVYFDNPVGVANILGRITGTDPSDILGTLGVGRPGELGTANLFLINPNGIIFGPDASLNVGGSFVGSTANSVNFEDGTQFSATNPEATPLLTITAPIGLRIGQNSGDIVVNGIGLPGVAQGQGLRVPPGNTLALVGGDVTLAGGILQAPGGRIELGGLSESGVVTIVAPNTLSFPDGVERADVSIASGAIVDVVAGGGGDVAINARNIEVSGGSIVCAGLGTASSCDTQGSDFGSVGVQAGNIAFNATEQVTISQSSRVENDLNPGATGNSENIFDAVLNRANLFGSILITGESFSLTDNAQISTSTLGTGSAGVVFVQAEGEVFIDNGFIFSTVESGGVGDAGGILIEAGSISLSNGTELQSQTEGIGNAGIVFLEAIGGTISLDNSRVFSTVESGGVGKGGNIQIETGSLILNNGSGLQTLIRGPSDDGSLLGGDGEAGLVFIKATDSVSIRGESGIFSRINEGAKGTTGSNQFAGNVFGALVGDGSDVVGSIVIITNSLFLTEASLMDASTFGEGNAGAVLVVATGRVSITNSSGILSGVGSNAIGNAGGVILVADSLDISNASGLTTETLGQGDAGLVLVVTNRDVSVKGEGSGIFSTAQPGSTGVAGGIGIEARSLYITDKAQVSVDNQGTGEAGGIFVEVYRDIYILDGGNLSARTLSGEGGDIDLIVGDFLVLGNGGNISTTAGLAPGGGNGGNLNIISPYIISAPLDDNNITAQAYTGNGGRIEINTNRLYAIARRDLDSLTSNDITASSRFGINGIEEINSVDIDPTQGLTNLPANPVDPSSLIAQNCTPRSRDSAREENKFTITGRGGLPPNPNSTLQSESVVTNWVEVDQPLENPMDNSTATPESVAPTAANVSKASTYTEAQGWVIGEKGEVILTAQTPTVTPHNSSLTPAAVCNGS